MSDLPKIKKDIKKEPPKQKRFYIGSLNTTLGQELVEKLRNYNINDENPHIIVGSLSKAQTDNPVPKGVFRVIDTKKVDFLSKVLLDSDIIIYDLNTCDLEEAEFAIKIFKMGEYKDEKILIFISSIMVWSNTPLKEKKEGDDANEEQEEGLEEPQSEEDENAPPPQQEEEEIQKKTYIRYTEKDYTQRNPLPKYEILKSLETLCISAGNTKPNLKTYVLCAGIQYGNGEDVLYERYFKVFFFQQNKKILKQNKKQAWLQNPKELLIFGEGKNRIPSIHVKDLATFAQKLTEKQPNQSYIFAIDHNQKPTQLSLVKAISKGLGTGLVKNIGYEEALQYENFDVFTVDVRIRPTKAFDQFLSQEDEEEENNEEEEGVEKKEKFKFEWHCKEGLPANIQKLNKQFNDYRFLKPNKILICGPPASGKSYFGEQLSQYYNIPHIKIQQVIEEIKNAQNELSEEIKQYCEEQKEALIEKAQYEFEIEKKKKKGKKVDPEQLVFDPSNIIVRLTDEQLQKIYRWRLSQTDCLNRGYVLDGYPKTFVQARAIFLKNKPNGEDDNQDDENAEKIVDENIMPQSVVFFDGSDIFLKQRIKELPEEELQNTHYNEEGMNRRLGQFRKDNLQYTGNPILIDFFKENNVDVQQVNVFNKTNQIFDNLRSYIERNGAFNNYMIHQTYEEKQRVKELEEQLKLQKEKEQEEERIRNQKEEESRKLQEEEYNIKMEKIKNTEKDKLNEKSYYLRQYLADNVVPFLTEGLIQLCKDHPQDPVDTLAQYLFKRSLQVKFPNPQQYNQY
ncbi:hypothetical protein IMG5_201950 [Ichthyophthirius multifiliis]|uniref:P-loop containing nucleoside triphosphate hydrolase n=1 Tax=Ichthyophthirius multifiliis TaxID=5932 RepID=G0R612_ICHMU|nr:hypothetical protein IMG5_201950 [Ichthyophthirius multifiliis]EGR27078.1 hypothetical protein IMG5_201950 [Ichthyophthirius multifiliis]|eukprot:XP_004023962.1 hypothetical protein IMG5_201950 [Ichthyophthirius multifiliis]